MALLVLAFAVALGELGASRRPTTSRQPHPRRAMLVALILLAVASVFVYSLPGLVWFAIAAPDLAGARARHREAAHRRRRAARRGPPPPQGDRRRGGGRGRGGGASPPPSSPASSARSARSRRPPAGSARRSSRARPSGSGRRATSRSSAARSTAPTRRWRWGCWRRRSARLAAVRRRDFGPGGRGGRGGDRVRGRPAVRLDLRGGQGAGGDRARWSWSRRSARCSPRGCRAIGLTTRPLRARRRSSRVALARLDLPGASRRAGRLRPARRRARGPRRAWSGAARSPSSGSTASPATGFAAR